MIENTPIKRAPQQRTLGRSQPDPLQSTKQTQAVRPTPLAEQLIQKKKKAILKIIWTLIIRPLS